MMPGALPSRRIALGDYLARQFKKAVSQTGCGTGMGHHGGGHYMTVRTKTMASAE